MYQTLLTSLENGVYIITINRPDKLNALNKDVFTDLNNAVTEIESNAAIKSAIITGAGPKAFVAGADISEFGSLDKNAAMALAKRGQDIFARIENCTKPIVAAVNGFALGGGCELAMACHFRVASENAKFGQPEVNLGLIPGYGGTQRLVQLIGKGKAMELLMSAHLIDANEAKQLGLINYVTTAETLLDHTKKILDIINSKAPLAIAGCIKAANAVHDESKDGYALEIEEFGNAFATEDMKEGTTAFLEKRKAIFKGK
ncbi:MAG: enoyl-CoA hydratase/isomerase family protein [Chitinophagaceae bacterium]|nr:enoyl-CoA hydratase/isomerase family protein [Chitinophagaceae bacterium]MBK8607717.1 enoyl-CoA hydratase/isomerase family protein [Chitinophagaceae bacterium]MBP6477959.1 enoyl-CoA hydratase/isomerase family protein [Chitinophagaceae bacterium]MBP7107130.1 enoyl-CoA hydratase/isomerase family protein [Chitinophagaceae bacterium]MBP7314871.1 enoyl-CoA hydratase/isomerase family protein [Chitinophagaceae bacterium]